MVYFIMGSGVFILLESYGKFYIHSITNDQESKRHLFLAALVGGSLFLKIQTGYDLVIISTLFLLSEIDFYTKTIHLFHLIPLVIVDLFSVHSFSLIGFMPIIVMALFALLFPDSFGSGDLILLLILSFYFQERMIFILLVSSSAGIIYGIYEIIVKKWENKKEIAFVPLLMIGMVMCYFRKM